MKYHSPTKKVKNIENPDTTNQPTTIMINSRSVLCVSQLFISVTLYNNTYEFESKECDSTIDHKRVCVVKSDCRKIMQKNHNNKKSIKK